MLRRLSLTTFLLVGCASQGDEGMIVLNNTAVGDSCSLSGSKDQPFNSHGEIFYDSPQGYLLTPLIESRIALGLGDEEQMDMSQRTIFLRGADVTLTLKAVSIETASGFTVTQPESNVASFGVLFSGSVPPAGTANVGFEVIPRPQLLQITNTVGAPAGAAWQAEVLAEVTIRGEMGGDEVTSSPFHFPISVCNDCVVVDRGACPIDGTVRTGNACNPFQDGVIDCCTDAEGFFICPGPSM